MEEGALLDHASTNATVGAYVYCLNSSAKSSKTVEQVSYSRSPLYASQKAPGAQQLQKVKVYAKFAILFLYKEVVTSYNN